MRLNRSRTYRPQLCPLLLLLALAGAPVAGGAAPSVDGMSHASWTGRDGAPQGINALAQTQDGYLWLGTSSGLYRFDGLKFYTYLPPPDGVQFASLDVVALAADSRNGLWIGFRLGGLSYLREGRLTNYDQRDGLAMSFVEQILPQPEGAVWVVTAGKLLKLEASQWRVFGPQLGLPEDGVRNVFFDRSGKMWVTADQQIYFLSSDHSKFVATGDQVKAVTQFLEAPDGAIWISDGWKRVRPLLGGPEARMPIRGTARFLFGPKGSLWVANDYFGLDVVAFPLPSSGSTDDDVEHLDESAGLTSKTCRAMIEDREGNIWIGTEMGLDRFQRLNFRSFTDLKLKSFPGLAAGANGAVWIVSLGTPLLLVENEATTEFGPKRGWGPIYRDKENIVWQYDYWKKELVTFDGKDFAKVEISPLLEKKVVQSITGSRDGDVYVAFEHDGIWRRHGHQWHPIQMTGVPARLPVSLLADASGRVWAGFADGQIGLNDRGRLQIYSAQGADNLGGVLTLYESGVHIWAGGSNGLSVLDAGGFHRLLAVEGAALRGISGIVTGSDGDVWLNAASGIVRLPASEVQRALQNFNYKMQVEIFDFRDGIAGSPAQLRPTPTAVADSTGRLWFATAGHVVSVNPASVARQRALPHIVIESILSDGVRQLVPASGTLAIRSRNLQIDYVGISLASPQRVTYRYKLDGEDTQWQEAGARRQAFYTSLSPGRYRFHVAAAIGDGRWTELELPADVVVPPAFYQTTWFIVASVIALIVALGIGHEVRVQQITQQVRDRLEQRAAERAQIARDLHDTLLQGIHGLMLRFHFVAQQMPESGPARRVMEDALTTADKVIEEGRDRVRSLRSEALTKEDLATRLAHVGTELNWDHSVQFSVATEGSSLALHPIVEDELYMIGREAVANSFRHAGASRIDVEINSDGHAIRLRCVDNGQGIGKEMLSPSEVKNHFGHLGMRERAAKIGATFMCRSAPGQGTEITVTLQGRLRGTSDTLFRLAPWALLKRWARRDAQGVPRA